MSVAVKICGITEAEHAHTAFESGADYLGFVFFGKSPRNLSLEAATTLAPKLPTEPKRVGVFVGADDALLTSAASALDLEYLQLHGGESVDRVKEIRALTGTKIIKAVGVSCAADLEKIHDFEEYVDAFLFDAKPPAGSALPGGNAVSFPWSVMEGFSSAIPWFLAGGLNAENVQKALKESGAGAVDISSGVERAAGKKDNALIQAFLNAAKSPT